MVAIDKTKPLLLFLGDILSLYLALYISLLIRYGGQSLVENWDLHFVPFSFLFLVFILNFFIYGFYETKNIFIKKNLSFSIFKIQILNSVLAVLFFYFIPYFAITPKTNLFIYLIVSLVVLVIWRSFIVEIFSSKTKNKAFLIGRGEETADLKDEINGGVYGFEIVNSINLEKVESVDIKEDIINVIYSEGIDLVIIDTKDDSVIPLLPRFYNLMFSGVQFIDVHQLYEYTFNKVPLSLVRHGWFLENFKSRPHILYDFLKRGMDIFLSLVLFLISLIFYPIVFILIKLDDSGSIFYFDTRIGKENKKIKIIKFRSMTPDSKTETRIGKFLRKTRIDELPQLINVLRGDLSLIGPRPEQPDKADKYNQEISFYNVRHLISPGLSGWAQIYHENHPHHDLNTGATKEKLSFDLYYVKNRSLVLDLKIALKTLKTLLLSKGR